MNPRTDFYARLALALLAALLASPIVALVLPETQFHRVMTRTFQATLAVILIWPNLPPVWLRKVRELGLRGPQRAARYGTGAVVGIGLLILMLWVSWLLGGRTLRVVPHDKSLASHLFKAAFIATLVPIAEEVLFRGYMLNRIGSIASALVYSLVHFLRPYNGSTPAGPDFDPFLGFKRFGELLQSFQDPRLVTVGVLSLFLIGLALNRLTRRTGTLWAPIGVHAGIVFGVEIYRRWLWDDNYSNKWIFGGGRLHDGLLGCIMAAVLLLLVSLLPLPRFLKRASP